MADAAQNVDRRPLTWLWMVLSILVVVGFLTWLGMASEPSTVPVVESEEEPDATEDELAAGVVVVPRDTLAENKARYDGQTIRVSNVEAAGILGPGIFWGELGDQARQVPMLVRMDTTLLQREMRVEQSRSYTITGTVHRMSDEAADAWGEAGEFTDEGAQLQAAFTDYYIQASNIRPAGVAGAGAGAPR